MNTQVSFHHQIFPLGTENKVRHSNWQKWIWISRKEGTQEFALPWEIPSLKLSLHKGLSSPQCRQRGKALWIVMQRWHLITSVGFWSRKEKFMKMQRWLRSNCLPCLSATSAATGAVAKTLCDDWPYTCWCYCAEAQLQHKELVFPAGFSGPGYKVKTVNAVDRPKALESLGRVKDWQEKALQ